MEKSVGAESWKKEPNGDWESVSLSSFDATRIFMLVGQRLKQTQIAVRPGDTANTYRAANFAQCRYRMAGRCAIGGHAQQAQIQFIRSGVASVVERTQVAPTRMFAWLGGMESVCWSCPFGLVASTSSIHDPWAMGCSRLFLRMETASHTDDAPTQVVV